MITYKSLIICSVCLLIEGSRVVKLGSKVREQYPHNGLFVPVAWCPNMRYQLLLAICFRSDSQHFVLFRNSNRLNPMFLH